LSLSSIINHNKVNNDRNHDSALERSKLRLNLPKKDNYTYNSKDYQNTSESSYNYGPRARSKSKDNTSNVVAPQIVSRSRSKGHLQKPARIDNRVFTGEISNPFSDGDNDLRREHISLASTLPSKIHQHDSNNTAYIKSRSSSKNKNYDSPTSADLDLFSPYKLKLKG
jgi:hypothetical protein